MKIGVFDSGMGGLLITKALIKAMPEYDYVYFGDTKRLPYGNRSNPTIYEFLQQAVDYLFKKRCNLIIVACNTASANALRMVQREYLPKNYPDRKVIGVLIPAAEVATEGKHMIRVGVLATQGTVNSGAYAREIKKLNKKAVVFQQAAPLLVPLIENNGLKWVEPVLQKYLRPLIKSKIQALILGCTHYPLLKGRIRKIVGPTIRVICQDEIVPNKLKDYLARHPEIEIKLGKNSKREFLVTDLTESHVKLARHWFGESIRLKQVRL